MKAVFLNNKILRLAVLFAIIVVSFFIFNLWDIKVIENIMQAGICILIFFYIFYFKRNDEESLIFLIILIGLIMRIGYMLYTPIDVRSHDFGGHISYINSIYNGSLPQNNSLQNYHPPLFHFLAAMFGRYLGSLKYDGDSIYEAAKIISCFASCVMLICTKEIAKELKFGKKGVAAATAIAAFFPNFYLLAGRINNDSLAVMFLFLSYLFTIKWLYKPCFKYVIFIALFIGFGMMTKISVGTAAFFTGPVMLYVLFKNFMRDKKDPRILIQLIVFGVICFPLALWYPIRNYILFDQPFNYVLRQSEELSFYLGEVSIVRRALSLPILEGIKSVYNDPWHDQNMWIYLLKGGMFGEFKFSTADFIPRTLTVINIFLTALSFVGIIYVAVSKKIKISIKYIVLNIWLVTLISYISINISMPFGCTMDFRYVVPFILVTALAVGGLYDGIYNGFVLKKYNDKLLSAVLKAIEIICFMFCLYSVLMYTTIN